MCGFPETRRTINYKLHHDDYANVLRSKGHEMLKKLKNKFAMEYNNNEISRLNPCHRTYSLISMKKSPNHHSCVQLKMEVFLSIFRFSL